MSSIEGSTRARLAVSIASWAPLEAALRAVTRSRLRVLAYHAIGDPAAFDRHVRWLVDRYRPVRGEEVAAAAAGGPSLPPLAVWVTFDDGAADVFGAGLDVLARHGVPATAFVCPGVISGTTPQWWEVVEAALARGPVEFEGRPWRDRSLVTRLKQVPDPTRRAFVAGLDVEALPRGASEDDLARWVRAGHTIGNHTWDHPCLDRCEPDDQRAQISRAHEWLVARDLAPQMLFAYPNGNWAQPAEDELRRLGYRVGCLFDHRLASMREPLRLSRLRADAHAGERRFRTIVSGAHAALFGLARRGAVSASAG